MKNILTLILLISSFFIKSAQQHPMSPNEFIQRDFFIHQLGKRIHDAIKNSDEKSFTEVLNNPRFELYKNRIINYKDIKNETALMHAARKGNYAILEYLLKNGALIDHQNNDGSTAAILACNHLRGQTLQNILKLFKIYGANFKIEDNQGNSVNSICGQFLK